MANYCSNYVFIYGSEDSIKQIMDKIEKLNESKEILWWETYHQFLELPLPKDGDVYKEFGSKWFSPEASEHLDGNESFMTIQGDSAWSPVIEFFRKISEKYDVKVEGEYGECGCDFGGFYEIENGEITKDKCMNYISYRYLEVGLDGVYSELEFYLDDEDKDAAMMRLYSANDVMSYRDFNEVKEWIKSRQK